MKTLTGYKCHLAESVIATNHHNPKAQSALTLLKAAGGNNLVGVEDADVILTIGGDGMMLRTIHHYREILTPEQLSKKTFFGFAFGTVNFLMNEFNWEDLGNLLSGTAPIQSEEAMTLMVKVDGREEMVVNDVVVGGEDLMSWLHYDVSDEENVFGNFEGTGLIMSTAIGSTAWNRNNGGVVLPLRSGNISVTGVGTNRPISEVIHGQKISIDYRSRSDCYIWIDGSDRKIGPYKKGSLTVEPGQWINFGFFDMHQYQIKRRQ